MKKKTLFTFLLLIAILTSASGSPPSSNWSLDFTGGATFGYFADESKITPNLSIGYRYSLNPAISLYGEAGAGQFRSVNRQDEGIRFDNNYLRHAFGVRLNLLRMLAGYQNLTKYAGFYTRAGIGFLLNDVSAFDIDSEDFSGVDYTGTALSCHFGAGLTFRISNRIDLFLQSDLHLSGSDLLDGYERLPGTSTSGIMASGDAFLYTNAGITLKLGSKRGNHIDWHHGDHRYDPMAQSLKPAVKEMEIKATSIVSSLNEKQKKLDDVAKNLEDLKHLVDVVHSDQFISHHSQIESLETRIGLLQSDLDKIALKAGTSRQTEERHFYIISGVFRDMISAETHFRQLQKDGFSDADIVRDRSRTYFLVSYMMFKKEEKAQAKMEQLRLQVNSDAWIYVQ